MSAGERDPDLEEWLDDARASDEAPEADYGAMLARVEASIADAEKRPSFWLRTRPTVIRRAIGVAAASLVTVVGGLLLSRRDLDAAAPLPLAVAVLGLGALLGVAVYQALHPLHRPPLSAWTRGATAVLTLLATFTVALLSGRGTPHAEALDHVSPCLFYGLLMGLPVYLVLRLLDRGAGAGGSLSAACAAGLLGNLVLSLHCPHDDVGHLMLGHFSVALLFVAGLGLVHVLVRASRR